MQLSAGCGLLTVAHGECSIFYRNRKGPSHRDHFVELQRGLALSDVAGDYATADSNPPTNLIHPLLMPYRQSVKHIPVLPPVRHESVHQLYKALVVGWFQEVHHFVDHNILQTPGRFLCEFGVESDVSGSGVAAAPLGLHLLNEEG